MPKTITEASITGLKQNKYDIVALEFGPPEGADPNDPDIVAALAMEATDAAQMMLRTSFNTEIMGTLNTEDGTIILYPSTKQVHLVFTAEMTRVWKFTKPTIAVYGTLLLRTAAGIDRPLSGKDYEFIVEASFTW